MSKFPENTLEPEAWAEGFDPDNTLDRDELIEWFHAAIQAGYDAARPLEPNIIHINDQMIAEETVFGGQTGAIS